MGRRTAVPYAYYNKHADSAHVSRLSYFLQTNMIRSDDQKQKPAAELNVLPAVAQFRTMEKPRNVTAVRFACLLDCVMPTSEPLRGSFLLLLLYFGVCSLSFGSRWATWRCTNVLFISIVSSCVSVSFSLGLDDMAAGRGLTGTHDSGGAMTPATERYLLYHTMSLTVTALPR